MRLYLFDVIPENHTHNVRIEMLGANGSDAWHRFDAAFLEVTNWRIIYFGEKPERSTSDMFRPNIGSNNPLTAALKRTIDQAQYGKKWVGVRVEFNPRDFNGLYGVLRHIRSEVERDWGVKLDDNDLNFKIERLAANSEIHVYTSSVLVPDDKIKN